MHHREEDGEWRVFFSIGTGRNAVNQHSATSGGFTRDTGNPPTGKRTDEGADWQTTIRIIRQVDRVCHRYLLSANRVMLDWMGLAWSGKKPLDGETISSVPAEAGLYLLFERDSGDLVYIGQSADCAKRLRSHAMKFLEGNDLMFSWYSSEKPLLPHNLKEWENDLIGNYFDVYRRAPKYQSGNRDY